MRWLISIPLITDSRVIFLIWFIIIAIIVAGVLIFVEFRLRKRRQLEAVRTANISDSEKVLRFLKTDVDFRKKLDFIDNMAKKYFSETYATSLDLSYSVLIRDFEKRGDMKAADFCKKMFENYYSHKKLDEDEVFELGKMLVDIEKDEERLRNAAKNLPFIKKVKRFFGEEENVVVDEEAEKVEKAKEIASEYIGKIKEQEVAMENVEIENWAKNAVVWGYSRDVVLNLLEDGKRSKDKIKDILKIYDGEVRKKQLDEANKDGKAVNIEVPLSKFSGDKKVSGGVAERIIKKEKDRLVKKNVFAS